jgi:hypothetical protein
MSEENIAAAVRMVEARNAGDCEVIFEYIDPGAEWQTTGLLVDDPDVYRGRDAVILRWRNGKLLVPRGNPVPQRPDLRTLRAGRDVGDPCRRVRSLIRNGYPADGARRDSAQSGSVPVPGGLDAAVSSGGAAAV